MDVSEFYLGRQPVVDRQQRLVGFELLFRCGLSNAADVPDDVSATATVISHAFGDVGIQEVLGPYFGLINVSEDLLLSDAIELLPAQRIVLEILETVELSPTVIARCQQLHKKGFRFALDDVVTLTPQMKTLLPLISIIKLDIPNLHMTQVRQLCQQLANRPVKILAEKVDEPTLFTQCNEAGASLFQGYYFARPTVLSGRASTPSEMALLKLLGLTMRDAETAEIEECLKLNADLSINLMKLVNSVASGLSYKISSLHHAITILGRRQLQRWLQLLLYTYGHHPQQGPSPLMQLASTRGRFMELLSIHLYPDDYALRERAFTVGLLSLLDALLNKPLLELLTPLNLANDINQALLAREGISGEMLQVAIQTETRGKVQTPSQLYLKLGTTIVNRLQTEALRWVNELSADMHN